MRTLSAARCGPAPGAARTPACRRGSHSAPSRHCRTSGEQRATASRCATWLVAKHSPCVHCPAAALSARGAQSRVSKTAGFDGTRVDRGLLDGRVGIQQFWEVVRSGAVMGGVEPGIKCSPDGTGAVQAVVMQPAPAEGIPGKRGLCPLPAKLRKPGTGLRGFADLVPKAPRCGRLIEALRDPLDDYEGAAGSEQFANVVKHSGGIRDVVKRKAGDDGIQRRSWQVVLESDPPVPR